MTHHRDLTDEQLEKLADEMEKEANEEGYDILDNIEDYLKELRDSKLKNKRSSLN